MSTTTITWTFKQGGVLTDADSVVLQDPSDTFGLKRTDTDEVLVEAGTAMTRASLGTYTYELTDPAEGITYNYWILVTYGGDTFYIEGKATSARSRYTCGPTLYDIRRQVVDLSGHYELVLDAEGEDFSDKGCDCLINAAQRWLNSRTHNYFAEDSTLSDDADTSWWSINYPDMLVRATRMRIEMDLHRNTSGANDFAQDLVVQLNDMYNRAIYAEVNAREEFDNV